MNFILQYWLQILFGFIISYLGYIAKRINAFFTSVKKNEESIKEILRGLIIFSHNEYISRKYISLTEKEVFNKLHSRLKGISDDPLIEALVKEVNTIPTQKEGD